VPDNPRIEELRRRVQKDPASIAFAQLAEEYRRAGHFEEAVKTCRAGLSRHPGYLSARVTLGRSLIETNDLDAAETELRYVLRTAPENLAAIRGLAEIHRKRGALPEALTYYRDALRLARHDPDLEQTVEDIARTLEPLRRPADAPGGMSFEQASAEFLTTASLPAPAALSVPLPAAPSVPLASKRPAPEPFADNATLRALPELQRFLDAIVAYRQEIGAV
jgi:tetratricopeptide (TPR) repeat protein